MKLNVTLGVGAPGEGKCQTRTLESTLCDGFDESLIHISKRQIYCGDNEA